MYRKVPFGNSNSRQGLYQVYGSRGDQSTSSEGYLSQSDGTNLNQNKVHHNVDPCGGGEPAYHTYSSTTSMNSTRLHSNDRLMPRMPPLRSEPPSSGLPFKQDQQVPRLPGEPFRYGTSSSEIPIPGSECESVSRGRAAGSESVSRGRAAGSESVSRGRAAGSESVSRGRAAGSESVSRGRAAESESVSRGRAAESESVSRGRTAGSESVSRDRAVVLQHMSSERPIPESASISRVKPDGLQHMSSERPIPGSAPPSVRRPPGPYSRTTPKSGEQLIKQQWGSGKHAPKTDPLPFCNEVLSDTKSSERPSSYASSERLFPRREPPSPERLDLVSDHEKTIHVSSEKSYLSSGSIPNRHMSSEKSFPLKRGLSRSNSEADLSGCRPTPNTPAGRASTCTSNCTPRAVEDTDDDMNDADVVNVHTRMDDDDDSQQV